MMMNWYVGFCQDFLNVFFEKVFKPIPLVYNLIMSVLWRHPENVELENVKVIHYCAPVSTLYCLHTCLDSETFILFISITGE